MDPSKLIKQKKKGMQERAAHKQDKNYRNNCASFKLRLESKLSNVKAQLKHLNAGIYDSSGLPDGDLLSASPCFGTRVKV